MNPMMTNPNVASDLAASAASRASDKMRQAINGNPNREKAYEASKEFEAVFVSQMMTHMFEGIKTDGMFGGGHAEEMFKSLMVDEYGKLVAARGGLGVTEMMMQNLIAQQEV